MRTLSSLSVRPVAPFCTGFTLSVQVPRVTVRPRGAGSCHGPAAMTVRCRELSRPGAGITTAAPLTFRRPCHKVRYAIRHCLGYT
jgi:hypothetical protein